MYKGGVIIMATISNYNKHLTLSERIKIETALNNRTSFKKISNELPRGKP